MMVASKPNVLFAVNAHWRDRIFDETDMARLQNMCNVIDAPVPDEASAAFLQKYLPDSHIVITSWDTAPVGEAELAIAPQLQLLTHAAGSVKPVVSDALWQRGIHVTSAAAAISYGVAEFCLGLMLTATKRAFWAGVATRKGQWTDSLSVYHGPQEIYHQNIGIIGLGHVGKHLVRLLHNFDCNLLVFDPYCSAEQAASLGVELVPSLHSLFERSMVVSINAPLTAQTERMIKREHFAAMPAGALFINTARSRLVDIEGMISELKKERIVACIDVTEVEPPPLEDELRHLPNVWLTPHEAGTVAQNMQRIGTFVTNEIQCMVTGQPLRYPVLKSQLAMIG